MGQTYLLAGNLKVGKPMLCCFFLSNSTQISSLENHVVDLKIMQAV